MQKFLVLFCTIVVVIIFVLFIEQGGIQGTIKRLKFYDVPKLTTDRIDDSDEYVRRQFLVCLGVRWCTYNLPPYEVYVLYRNNNQYSDKRYGRVVERGEYTYTIEERLQNGTTTTVVIPKKWVFAKD